MFSRLTPRGFVGRAEALTLQCVLLKTERQQIVVTDRNVDPFDSARRRDWGRVMESLRDLVLLDHDGSPLGVRTVRVLTRLLPRLRRQFPALQDEVALIEVLEEAGRRVESREKRGGPIERLHGYAWVTVRSVATSRMRRGATRLIQKTLESKTSQVILASVRAVNGSAEEVERDILLRELLGKLSRKERLVCVWKRAGFSSQEIAKHQKRSVAAVDTLFSRAKQKLRRFLGVLDTGNCEHCSRRNGQIREPRPRDEEHTETDDGTTGSAK